MTNTIAMNVQLQQRADDYFQQRFGISLDALTAPIEASMPAGKSVRGNGVYNTIEQARRQDDASLPMGGWEHDLKRADWDKVGSVAVHALVQKSKDLQLVGWLLEAQINQTGFAGIAACMLLMQTLCERYWSDLYPQMEEGDVEYRANVIRWIGEKLLPALRLVPFTSAGREREYSWADWEQARRHEQARVAAGGRDREEAAQEGISAAEISAAMAATASADYLVQHGILDEALDSIEAMGLTLDRLFGADAPSLGAMAALLSHIQSLLDSELHKRGVRVAGRPALEPAAQQSMPFDPAAAGQRPPLQSTRSASAAPATGEADQPAPPTGPRDRADAYARLAEIVDFLTLLEPHSPVPYLLRRAYEWGNMNTAALYQELFLRLGGQLNIFEMLGLQAPADDKG